MIQIHLNQQDRIWATETGQLRWDWAKKKGSKARFKDAKPEHHIDGAGAELAFCRALGLSWQATVNTYKNVPDVFPSWEIRLLRVLKSKYAGVKVTPEDPDDALVVWMAGQMPDYMIMGYMRAGGAKKHPEWWFEPDDGRKRPYFRVPPNKVIEINPGFHRLCEYLLDDWGQWSCAFCGVNSGAA